MYTFKFNTVYWIPISTLYFLEPPSATAGACASNEGFCLNISYLA